MAKLPRDADLPMLPWEVDFLMLPFDPDLAKDGTLLKVKDFCLDGDLLGLGDREEEEASILDGDLVSVVFFLGKERSSS